MGKSFIQSVGKRARIVVCVALSAMLACMALAGCSASQPTSNAKTTTLRIAAPWADLSALEQAATKYATVHPEVTIEYEFVQDYTNALPKRLEDAGDQPVDLFFASSLKSDSPYYPYAYDFKSSDNKVDLSQTFPGLIENAGFTDDQGTEHLMLIPFGGEVRGVFVNKTLLNKAGLSVPTTREELLSCCESLKQAGYVPLQGNPGTFAQRLLYPYCVSLITNQANPQAYADVSANNPGISSYFQEPMGLMYDMMSNDYYNYKYVETNNKMFTDVSDEGYAKSFFNIVDGKKVDDAGIVPFMAGTQAMTSTLEKCKVDYSSNIDYEFILAPVTNKGGIAYLSPTQGLAANKTSQNLDASLEFLNWFYQSENNKDFAENNGTIPNTTDAISYMSKEFNIPESDCIELGQATFDYPFYTALSDSLIEVSKGNNPKYMKTAEDGSTTLYDLQYYMDNLEGRFAETRSK